MPAVTELGGRVDRIDAELAAALAAYKSELKRLQDRIDATEPTAVAPVPQVDLLVGLEKRLAALESGLEHALARRDNPPANPPAADRLSAVSAVGNGSGFETLATSNKPSSSGLGLSLASGLLADNLAGQPLTQWIDLLQQHSRVTGTDARFAALVNAAAAKPEPIPLLMRRAQLLQPLLVRALNAAADDAGFLQRAGARLGQLVQLRATSLDQSGNAGAVQAFEMALSQQDFDGVLIALGGWQICRMPWTNGAWRLSNAAHWTAVRATVTSLLAMGMESNQCCGDYWCFSGWFLPPLGLPPGWRSNPAICALTGLDGTQLPTSLAVALVVVFAFLLVCFDRILRAILALPGWLGGQFRQRRDAAGHRALTLGLMAVSAGEPEAARKQAIRAQRLLDAPQLTGLLAAQAAQLATTRLHGATLPQF